MNDIGPFSFQMEQGDISSFEPVWDCFTDLHRAASLGKHVETSALGWNKSEFVKYKDMDSDA